MSRSGQKGWSFLRRLNNDPSAKHEHLNISPNQIAHQMILNGKLKTPTDKINLQKDINRERTNLAAAFTMVELETAVKRSRNGKATGLDDIRVEQIKHSEKKTIEWLLQFLKNCMRTCKIPKIWRKHELLPFSKPGKYSSDPKNYRPISLLCHLYNIFERMLLNRLASVIDPRIIPQQAGFRPGKNCPSQILALT